MSRFGILQATICCIAPVCRTSIKENLRLVALQEFESEALRGSKAYRLGGRLPKHSYCELSLTLRMTSYTHICKIMCWARIPPRVLHGCGRYLSTCYFKVQIIEVVTIGKWRLLTHRAESREKNNGKPPVPLCLSLRGTSGSLIPCIAAASPKFFWVSTKAITIFFRTSCHGKLMMKC